MNTKIIGVVVSLIALLGVVGFVVVSKMKTPAAVTQTPEIRSVGTTEGKKKVVEVTVTAKDFSFDLKEIRVKAGDIVTVTLKNVGKMPHDWTVEGQNIQTRQINNGETDVIQFVAPQAGSYETFCSVGTHRQMGMVGVLLVE